MRRLVLNYDNLDIDSIINKSRFGRVNKDLLNHVPKIHGQGKVIFEPKLFGSAYKMVTKSTVALWMEKENFVNAKFEHLLLIALMYPGSYLKKKIIALNALTRINGGKYVAEIGTDGAGRNLEISWEGMSFGPSYRFLGIKILEHENPSLCK